MKARLAGRSVLLTGASGFVGKALLGQILRELPATAVTVLLRGDAQDRLTNQVLTSAPCEGLDGSGISAVSGDLGREDALEAVPATDIVIHCAASVSFEQPLDEALELNGKGPARLLQAARDAGGDPYFVHISTAYAAGQRTGLVLERPSGTAPSEPDLDLEAELDAARAWRRDIEAESRLPIHQKRFVREAERAVGPAGGPAVGARAEQLRHGWVYQELVERGRQRARALGWSDTYTLSKAIGERRLIAAKPRQLTIVRPAIVESALTTPYAGWMESLKVADPILLGYGAGIIPGRFAANRAIRIDIIPVDFVANACLAAAAHPPGDAIRTVNVATGTRNPLTIHALAEITTKYFRERPLPGEDGLPVEVSEWRLSTPGQIMKALDRAENLLGKGRDLVEKLPLPRYDELQLRVHKDQRRLDRLRRLNEIYMPYGELDCVFDDRNLRALFESLHPDDQERFSFDVDEIDWEHYLTEVHLPALRAIAVPPAPGPQKTRSPGRRPAPEGPPALAIFDVEGVVLDSTVAHFYQWLRTREMPELDKLVWTAGVATKVPGWIMEDRRSRTAFNRSFYRLYKDLPARELKRQAQEALPDFIQPRIQHEAVRRIREHKRRGDRVVLVTGALDFLVESLQHLGDELIAARLVERVGRFTGELAEPPLTADGRASLAARLAADHNVDLAHCHAYGDSLGDLPLLELVGHPHAINPDFRLSREARRRRWPVETWTTERAAV